MGQLSHEELQSLLGAFVLDAVDADEADAVEAHLDGCPRCRAEVAADREVVALLAHTGSGAPEGLWDRIASALEEAPPALRLVPTPFDALGLPPLAPPPPLATRDIADRRVSRRVSRFAMGVAAVSAIAAAILGVVVFRLDSRLAGVQRHRPDDSLLALAAEALAAPGSRTIRLASVDGKARAEIVVDPAGQGYLVHSTLAALPADRTYQLWGVVGGDKVSLGVLGNDPGIAAFRLSGPVSALAITDEHAGGVVSSAQPSVVIGYLGADSNFSD